MKLYLLSQDKNNRYDTYDSAVVCSANEDEARMTHPSQYRDNWSGIEEKWGSWVDAKDINVKYIGEADESLKKGIICASFNAG